MNNLTNITTKQLYTFHKCSKRNRNYLVSVNTEVTRKPLLPPDLLHVKWREAVQVTTQTALHNRKHKSHRSSRPYQTANFTWVRIRLEDLWSSVARLKAHTFYSPLVYKVCRKSGVKTNDWGVEGSSKTQHMENENEIQKEIEISLYEKALPTEDVHWTFSGELRSTYESNGRLLHFEEDSGSVAFLCLDSEGGDRLLTELFSGVNKGTWTLKIKTKYFITQLLLYKQILPQWWRSGRFK